MVVHHAVTRAEPIKIPFELWPKKVCTRWGAHWRNLANTSEPSMCGGDAAFLSNYVDHLSYCASDIISWCTSRRLQLNTHKTEATGIWIGSKSNLSELTTPDCSVPIGE